MTQNEFAWQVGCTTSMLQKIEANQRKPSKHMASALARVLKIPPHKHLKFIEFARGSASAKTAFHPATNLPVPPTRLIGREEELAKICSIIQQDDTRLVTLTGPPGVGKTRTALQAATELLGIFPDGVYFIPLATLTYSDSVIPTIIRTIGLQESRHKTPTEQLSSYLTDKIEMLILDNFEQVEPAAIFLSQLLGACPFLKLIVTSRLALRLRAERLFPLDPLRLPKLSDDSPIKELIICPSVALFVERAQAVNPRFQITKDNAATIALICHQLDGLPLAIELIAARLSSLSPQEILSRMSGDFVLYSQGARDTDQRHKTLKTAIDWSYNLLSTQEQTLFTRAGVFSGDWSIEAAQSVLGRMEVDPDNNTLQGLTSLVNKNLIQHHVFSEISYYSMLDTIREYALKGLALRNDIDSVYRSHASYYLALAESAEPNLRLEHMLIWLSRLDHEYSNLLAALDWSLNAENTLEIRLRLAYALHWYWLRKELAREGQHWLGRVIASNEVINLQQGMSDYLIAKALLGAGRIAWALGDYNYACETIETSIRVFQDLNDPWHLCFALISLSYAIIDLGRYEQALALAKECLSLADKLRDPWLQAQPRAVLGELARIKGEDPLALSLYADSQNLMSQAGDQRSVAFLIQSAGQIAINLNDYSQARKLLSESLIIHDEYNVRRGIATGFEKLAGIEVLFGEPKKAARLLGAANKLRSVIGSPVEGTDMDDYEETVAATHAALDEQSFTAAWAEGREMPLEVVIGYASSEEA